MSRSTYLHTHSLSLAHSRMYIPLHIHIYLQSIYRYHITVCRRLDCPSRHVPRVSQLPHDSNPGAAPPGDALAPIGLACRAGFGAASSYSSGVGAGVGDGDGLGRTGARLARLWTGCDRGGCRHDTQSADSDILETDISSIPRSGRMENSVGLAGSDVM